MQVVPFHSLGSRTALEVCPVDRLQGRVAPRAADDTSLDAAELRILALLWRCGAQPAVDTRDVDPAGNRRGLTVIGREAGCNEPHRVPEYLESLHRRGLIRLTFARLALRRYDLFQGQFDGPHDSRLCSIRITAAGERRVLAETRAAARMD